jgi:hypothetical protein
LLEPDRFTRQQGIQQNTIALNHQWIIADMIAQIKAVIRRFAGAPRAGSLQGFDIRGRGPVWDN